MDERLIDPMTEAFQAQSSDWTLVPLGAVLAVVLIIVWSLS